MRKIIYLLVLNLVILLALQGCNADKSTNNIEGKSKKLTHARLFKIKEIDEHTTLVDLINPWDTTTYLGHFALVERGHEAAPKTPDYYNQIEVPIKNSVVYSGLHTALINELGALESVSGVCDADYITDSATIQNIRNGKIKDCGRNNAPILEKIISLKPEAIILSPYFNSNEDTKYKPLGINVIQAADYMEKTPLARAEWIKLFGLLYGASEKADSIYSEIETKYNEIKTTAQNSRTKPTVLFDRIYSGGWDVPTSGSVTGNLIEDAGGVNPFAKYKNGGSAHLTAEEVLHTAHDADVWLIRYSGTPLTLKSLAKENDIYSKFKCYKTENIYIANSLTSQLFEDGAFHPERILLEMFKIIHPELNNEPTVYYNKIAR